MTTDYPDWLVDLIPGAADLRETLAKRAQDATPHRRRVAEMISAFNAITRRRGGKIEALPGVTTAEVDAAEIARQEAQAQASRANRQVDAAAKAYDSRLRLHDLEPTDRADVHRKAASIAVEAQEDAVRLAEELAETLDRRDLASRYAGRPGRSWEGPGDLSASRQAYFMDRVRAVRIGSFDLGAHKLKAAGEHVGREVAPDPSAVRRPSDSAIADARRVKGF